MHFRGEVLALESPCQQALVRFAEVESIAAAAAVGGEAHEGAHDGA